MKQTELLIPLSNAGRTIATDEAPYLAEISPRYAQGIKDMVFTTKIRKSAPVIPFQPAISAPYVQAAGREQAENQKTV